MTDQRLESLRTHASSLAERSLEDLFSAEEDRLNRMTVEVDGLYVDFSRHRIDRTALDALLAYGEACGLSAAAADLLDGSPLNVTEGRAALHSALRSDAGRTETARTAHAEANSARQLMFDLVERVHDGRFTGITGKPIRQVVSIGIGGSDLGPRLAVAALGSSERSKLPVHFAANVDGHALAALLPTLDPETTLWCVISKSFSTRETLLNATTARQWMADQLGVDASRAGAQFVAVTSRTDRAEEFGIRADAVLPMWDWVGGRYSVWSTVGLPVALALGPAAFDDLLAGAAAMDHHFREAEPARNLPMLLALVGFWHRSVCGVPAYTTVPYDERLALLGEYLQQLDMESNGKRITRDGQPVDGATGPACWGGVGTNSQHAYFQWLHQGTDPTPVDFIGIAQPDHAFDEHHRELLANLVGQGWALMRGRGESETADALGLDDPALVRQGVFPGNRPSTTILLDRLTPRALGSLLALYEHKIFCQGWLWQINSFDQWGVELGKTLAKRVAPWLTGTEPDADVDPSTRALIERLRR